MELKDIIPLINSVGFPIFVAVFLMVKMDKSIKSLEHTIGDAVNSLKDTLLEILKK
jgi:hypothetical protein